MGVTNEGRRTQALRGPGAGGFTPATSVAASNPCLNCGTNIQLEYCPECGQREIDTDPTLKEFLRGLAAEIARRDGRLLRTFRMLLTQPGALTSEYHEGRRVRYLSPIAPFVICTALFFTIRALLPARILAGDLLLTAVPIALFLLAPLFGALMGVAYADRRRHYPQHLVFALHMHAIVFLVLSAVALVELIPALSVQMALETLLLIPVAVYCVRASQRVYASGAAQAVIRSLGASAAYLALVAGTVWTAIAVGSR